MPLRRTLGIVLLSAAAFAGLVHAASSAYWSAGGVWLADTVGPWAIDWVREDPVAARTALALIAVAKLAAALLPLIATLRRIPLGRVWRALAWPGAIGLILYGSLGVVTSAIDLGRPDLSSGDRIALEGRAFLWDPLFLAWGAFLLAGLLLTPKSDRSHLPVGTVGITTASPARNADGPADED